MSTEIEKHYVQTFKDNVMLLSQQTKSKLEGFVTVQPCTGFGAAVADQYGSVKARKKTERHEDTKYSDTPRDRRWLVPQEYYSAELVDKSDILRMLTDPQSNLVRVHVAAMNRAKDSEILTNVFASARRGEQPTSGTVAYDTGNDIATDIDLAGTPSGLSPFKLVKAKGRLMRNKVDLDSEGTPTCVVNTKGWEDLFGQTQYVSGDFNGQKPMAEAPTSIYYGGSNLVQIEHDDFPVNGTTDYQCPYFVKGGIVLGVWQDIEVEVQKHPLKVSSWEVKVTARFAATRVEEAKVARVRIKY
jgi:hypothetical protein